MARWTRKHTVQAWGPATLWKAEDSECICIPSVDTGRLLGLSHISFYPGSERGLAWEKIGKEWWNMSPNSPSGLHTWLTHNKQVWIDHIHPPPLHMQTHNYYSWTVTQVSIVLQKQSYPSEPDTPAIYPNCPWNSNKRITDPSEVHFCSCEGKAPASYHICPGSASRA